MALRATPTIAICLTAGIAAGIALARPADEAPSSTLDASAATANTIAATPANDSPYLNGDETQPTDDTTQETANSAAAIPIEGFTFFPPDVVAAGATVAVTNRDGAAHTLTARDGAFDTGTLGQDEAGIFTAPIAPGTYEFFCQIHPSMTATLLVG